MRGEHGGYTQCLRDRGLRRDGAAVQCVPRALRLRFRQALFDVVQKELAIRASSINPDTHLRAVELLSAGRINVEPPQPITPGTGEMEQAIKMQMGGESI